MTDAPMVSVLMGVYNGATYLREAIDSILAQTFSDFEFIIVDDGSHDDTPLILDSYTDPRIVRLRNDVNIGLTRSLNRGLSVTRGKYIARQDANDISYPQRLARQLSFLEANPNVAAVGTAYREIYEDVRESRLLEMPLAHAELAELLLYQHPICHACAMLRHSSMKRVGGYDERYRVAQDRDLWLRLSEYYPLANLPEPLYDVRMLAASITGQQRPNQRLAVRQAGIEAIRRGTSRFSASALGRFYWLQVMDELTNGSVSEALDFLNQARQANPLLDHDHDYLARSAVTRAFELARAEPGTGHDYEVGFAFLNNLVRLLPTDMAVLRDRQGWMRSELSAAFAFASAQFGDPTEVRRFCRRAWASHSGHWRNRGLVSVFLHSFIPKLSISSRSTS